MNEVLRYRLSYANGDSRYPEQVKLLGINDDRLKNDERLKANSYFKINFDDSAAYRVRFNFVHPNPEADCQIIAIE